MLVALPIFLDYAAVNGTNQFAQSGNKGKHGASQQGLRSNMTDVKLGDIDGLSKDAHLFDSEDKTAFPDPEPGSGIFQNIGGDSTDAKSASTSDAFDLFRQTLASVSADLTKLGRTLEAQQGSWFGLSKADKAVLTHLPPDVDVLNQLQLDMTSLSQVIVFLIIIIDVIRELSSQLPGQYHLVCFVWAS